MKILDLTHMIDETMPVFPGTEPPKIIQKNTIKKDGFAEKLLSTVRDTQFVDGREFHVTASLGVSFFPEDGKNLEELASRADMAMYCAKKAGGNQYSFYTKLLNETVRRKLQIETSLRESIAKQEFAMHRPSHSRA